MVVMLTTILIGIVVAVIATVTATVIMIFITIYKLYYYGRHSCMDTDNDNSYVNNSGSHGHSTEVAVW